MNQTEPHSATSLEIYRRLLGYVRPYRKTFGLSVVGMALTACTEPMFPAIIKRLTDSGFVARNPSDLWLVPFALVAIFLVRGLLTFFTSYAMAWTTSRIVLDLRRLMFDRLLSLPTRYYDDQSTGALISKVTYNVGDVTGAATSVLTTSVRDSLTVLGLLGYLCWINWQLTLMALSVGPVIIGVVKVFGKRLRAASRRGHKAMGMMTHILEEAVGAHKVVKIFGGQAYESRRFDETGNEFRRAAMRESMAASATVPLTHMATAISMAIVIYFALAQPVKDQSTVGGFIAFVTAMLMLLAPVKRLTEVSAPLQRGLAAAESIFSLLDEPAEADTGTLTLPRARGELEFQGVGFTYDGANRPALSDISLKVESGKTIALVGHSGSGKTTLIALIPRFYHPQQGRILLDGLDIRDMSLDSLRANIALVSQDVVLFNDTVAANIAYGSSAAASEEAVIDAAKAANAWEFIKQMPEGLQTQVGENGVKLSGGQRQRLAIARAFLKNAPILILDEATSALDSQSERQIQGALETLMQGRTTLVIAHRLSTVEHADSIMVLDRGRIVEEGRHAQLLLQNGMYANLYRLQFEAPGER
jgi:subfamily B ATP-binding cassette protein MsbA